MKNFAMSVIKGVLLIIVAILMMICGIIEAVFDFVTRRYNPARDIEISYKIARYILWHDIDAGFELLKDAANGDIASVYRKIWL